MANQLVEKNERERFKRRFCVRNEKGDILLKIPIGYGYIENKGPLALFTKRKKWLLINIQTATILEKGVAKINLISDNLYQVNSNICSSQGTVLYENEICIYEKESLYITKNLDTLKKQLMTNKGKSLLTECDDIIFLKPHQYLIRKDEEIEVIEIVGESIKSVTKKISIPKADQYQYVYCDEVIDRAFIGIGYYCKDIRVMTEVRRIDTLDIIIQEKEPNEICWICNLKNSVCKGNDELSLLYSLTKQKTIANMEKRLYFYPLSARFWVLQFEEYHFHIYDDVEGDFIFEGKYDEICPCENHSCFIITDLTSKKKGLISFEGTVLLEPVALEIEEVDDGFTYTEEKFIAVQKIDN